MLCNQGDENMDALLYGMLCAVMGLPLDTNMDWFIPAHRDFSAPLMIRGRYIGHEGVPSIVCIHCEEDGTLLRGTRDGEDLRLIYCGGARFLAVKPDESERCRLPSGIPDSRRPRVGRPRRHTGF